jgi:leucine dehydrogenase
MPVFSDPDFHNHEQVVFAHDADAGLRAIIAIHDTTLGPALGGCRIWPYESDAAALTDVLRLSRGMTYKAAVAGVPLGGGKGVVIADPRHDKNEALLRALGRHVDRLGGRYITAEDVGTTVADMTVLREETRHVAGIAEGGSGDPSPATAYGVYVGIRAAVAHKLGRNSLDGIRVAVQGLGNVGRRLCDLLVKDGGRLIVADVNREAVERAVDELGASPASPETIHDAEAELFAPCALGAVVNDTTIPRLKVRIVAGSANNQLAEDRHGAALAERGILYAPDYVINAGGLINIAHEDRDGAGNGYDADAAMTHVASIRETLAEIFARADREGLPTNLVADRLAMERLRAA